MIDNFMDLNFIGQENPFGEFVLIHMEQQDFSYSYSDQGGTFFITYLDDQSLESGTYTITKMEP
jgi:hypothetical protein